jgi:ubiquinone/menaquinone biosynthesis C-methylase UbiE
MYHANRGPTESPVNATMPRVTPERIIETTFAFAQSCALLAAVELDLFTRIAQGMKTIEVLANQAGVSANALGRLLGTLSAMGFLQRNGDDYALTPVSERFLVRGQPSYVGDIVLQIRQEWDAWLHLSECVRTGQPTRFINEEPLGGPFFAPLDASLFPLIHPLMRMICQRLEIGSRFHGIQVLDLGAGAAPSAIATLQLDADAYAVAIDFPEALAQAQAYAQKYGVEQRMEYWPANLETIELPPGRFDLIFASHVFRILGVEQTQRLIQQCFQSLTSGGRLVVVETYNDQGAKLFPYIVSLNMLVNTRQGDAFTSQQMHEWLATTGFQVEAWPNVGPDLVLVARCP